MESPCFSRPQSTTSHLFARTRSFHRPTYKRPGLHGLHHLRSAVCMVCALGDRFRKAEIIRMAFVVVVVVLHL